MRFRKFVQWCVLGAEIILGLLMIYGYRHMGDLIYDFSTKCISVLDSIYALLILSFRKYVQILYTGLRWVIAIFLFLYIWGRGKKIGSGDDINNGKLLFHKTLKILTSSMKQVVFLISVILTYGISSSGVSISLLSGIAEKNAVIAFLGGGSKSTGGAGMELGYKIILLVLLYIYLWPFIVMKIKEWIEFIKNY